MFMFIIVVSSLDLMLSVDGDADAAIEARIRMKLIKIARWSGWWVGECFFWYQLTQVVPDKGP